MRRNFVLAFLSSFLLFALKGYSVTDETSEVREDQEIRRFTKEFGNRPEPKYNELKDPKDGICLDEDTQLAFYGNKHPFSSNSPDDSFGISPQIVVGEKEIFKHGISTNTTYDGTLKEGNKGSVAKNEGGEIGGMIKNLTNPLSAD